MLPPTAVAALRRAEVNLENEYARSEALIATMMPPSIATRLKLMPDQRIADRIECLSILFADLVGFTKAARSTPRSGGRVPRRSRVHL